MKYPFIEVERIKHGMSKTDFADALGVHPRTVSNWQNGRVQIPLKKLLQMSDMFHCSTGYLLGREVDLPQPISPNDMQRPQQ